MEVNQPIRRRSPRLMARLAPSPGQSSNSAGEFVNPTQGGGYVGDASAPMALIPTADGTTMTSAISVEDYCCKRKMEKLQASEPSSSGVKKVMIDLSRKTLGEPSVVIDLTQDNPDDEIQILEGMPSFWTSSKSKPYKETAAPTFLCEICCDEKQTSEAFQITGCNHSYCSDCVSKFVASKLQDNVSRINCPVSGCKGVLEPHHCRSILPKQVFDRWGDALCEALLLSSEKFYCPFKDCSALLIDEKMNIEQSECPECRRLFCAKCKVPWHSDIACDEFQKLAKDERETEDIQLMNFANQNKWKRCPDCRVYVERVAGCPFITCRCRCRFCYLCGAPTKRDHFCNNCGT